TTVKDHDEGAPRTVGLDALDAKMLRIHTQIVLPAGPCLPGATRLRRVANQSLVYQSLQLSIDKSAVDPSAGDQSAVCRAAGQHSGIGNCSTVPPGQTIYHQPGLVSQPGVVQKINEISINLQYTQKSPNWSPKTSRSVQNEVQIGAKNHQIHEKIKKSDI
ncbi:MAG: hypothetical protein VXY56_09010, partial [Pseudomonadota bacterium]|nr:hypothetical protein [Pseudomonadota bacterium]